MKTVALLAPILALLTSLQAVAWDGHDKITRLSFDEQRRWAEVEYEPLENVLAELTFPDGGKALSRAEFITRLNINGDKVGWDWKTGGGADALDVLGFSADEVDLGMDQDLKISPDQKYLGGFTGLSSQAIRHMYLRAWSWRQPLVTFHFPTHEMGFAIERAKLYFDLATQAKRGNHLFWAYRFLGWGLHYVQDLGQPYHTTQFASPRLLALETLLTKGWEPFIAETTRLVSNFHLSFEEYVKLKAQSEPDSRLIMAFRIPNADPRLKSRLEGIDAPGVGPGLKLLAATSAEMAAELVKNQNTLLGESLRRSGLDLRQGMIDETGQPRVPIQRTIEDKSPAAVATRQKLENVAERALSNTGVAIRWYVGQFLGN